MKARTLSVVGACILATSAAELRAQVTGATVVGKITDSTGAAIPKASIDLLRDSTGTHRTVLSNDAGSFTVPNLTPGTYTLTVTAASFGVQTRQGLTLNVGEEKQEDFAMNPGSLTEQVSVTSTSPALDLASSQVSNVVDSTTVRQLPLSTRDWTLLATLQPGVSLVRTEKAVAVGADRGNRGYGAQLTVAGGRPQQNNYRMDGISINDYSNGAPGSVAGVNLGVDAIQEFSVVTANASADYGREAGGVINAVSRGGANDFHGSAFEFFRNDFLDARNYFDPARIGKLRKNQFGGTLGGRIIRDRTFFFGNYEGIRQIAGVPFTVNAPSPNARKGILACSTAVGGVQQAGCPTPGPGAASSTYTVPVGADTAQYLNFYGIPTQNGNTDTAQYFFSGKQVTPENFAQGRLDQIFTSKDSGHATYNYDAGDFTQPDAENNYFLFSHTKRQLALLEETHIFSSSFVNTARVGVSRNLANITSTSAGSNNLAADTSLGGVPGKAASSLVIGGLTNFGGGLNAPSQYNFYWTSIQGYDDAFYTIRNHTLRFGGAVERMRNNIVATSSPAGLYTFGSTADFIAGRVQNFQAQLPGSVPEKGLRQTLGAGYILDDWKAAKNLTFNIGVRYEAVTNIAEVHNNTSHLSSLTQPSPTLGGSYFSNPTLKNFEPRVGLVWDPYKQGKTVVRAGFGIFDILPLPYQFELLGALAAPYLQTGLVAYSNVPSPYTTTQPGDGKFAHNSFNAIKGVTSSYRQSFVQPDPHRSYLMEWNANVEQDFGYNYSMYLGFVGSRGVHQPFRTDEANTVQPLGFIDGKLTFPKPGTQPVLNPNVGQIAAIYYNNNTYYNGLQAGLSKKMSYGFQGQISYTFSKAIDLGSAVLAGDPFGNSISGLFPFYPQLRKGVADFNVPNEFTLNFLYQLPKLQHLAKPLDLALNGWETTGIFFAQNGLPFTPTIAGDSLGLKGSAPFNLPNRLQGPNCSTGVNSRRALGYINLSCFAFPRANPDGTTVFGNAGRNSLTGPRIYNLDFSMMKNTKLTERFNVQFRAEVYNLLNHTNFSPPIANRTVFTAGGAPVATAGNITSTVTTSRQLQFGLKLVY